MGEALAVLLDFLFETSYLLSVSLNGSHRVVKFVSATAAMASDLIVHVGRL